MLHFPDPAKLKTRKVVFEEVFPANDCGTLEQLKELSSKRQVIEETVNATSMITEAVAREISGGLTSLNEQETWIFGFLGSTMLRRSSSRNFGLDGHRHLKTLKPLSERSPDLRVVATPNAKSLLDPLFRDVTYLEPVQSLEVEGRNGWKVKVKDTPGPVLGPPWQGPENLYLVSSPGRLILYYEPHCVFNKDLVGKERADIVITPVIKQLLPSFTLVSEQEDADQLAKLLQAKFVVPLKNGDLDSKGYLGSIIQSEGNY